MDPSGEIFIFEIEKKLFQNTYNNNNNVLVGKNGTYCGAEYSTKTTIAATRSIRRAHVNWCKSPNIKAKHDCK